MKKYLLVYKGSVRPEDGQQHIKAWMAWVHDLGDAMIDPGIPVSHSKTLSINGVVDTESSHPISGVSIMQAENFEAVIARVKSCPHIDIGGSIEVAEAMDMPMV